MKTNKTISVVVSLICGLFIPFSFAAADSEATTTTAIELLPEITIRAGVLHAPPFATVMENPDGTYEFGGLQIDLLESLKVFAAQDNVKLDFQLEPSPISYGEAFDLVSNDCDESLLIGGGGGEESINSCNKFDLIVADYYANGPRSLRAELSPSWLKSTISTAKYKFKGSSSPDVTTMKQAVALNAPVCVTHGTYYANVLLEKFPDATWRYCPSQEECIQTLKEENCVLYADDELQLRYRAAKDDALEVTRESFNTQYLVWASRFGMEGSPQLRKWIYDAVANATMDDLFFKYFQKELCPVGTAGESCELPCDPEHGEADASGKCVCISTKWTGDDCSIEVPEDTNDITNTFLIIAWILLSINCFTILGFGIWMYWKRDSTQVRICQPFFLCMILLGCLISSSTIGAMAQASSDDNGNTVPACMAIPWLYSVGFCVTFGTLFAKIRRVYRMFKSAAEHRRSSVTFRETIMITAGVLLLDVIVLLVWTIVDPLRWERTIILTDKFGETLESEGHCTCNHWEWWIGTIALLHLSLLAVACYMCYVSRDISTKFSEGKYVSIAMFSNFQIFLLAVPILIILGSDPDASFFIRTVVVWINDFVVVTLIFGNLVYHVHFSPKEDEEDGSKKAVDVALGSAINKFSKSQQERRSSSKPFSRVSIHNRSNFLSRNSIPLSSFQMSSMQDSIVGDLPDIVEEHSGEVSRSSKSNLDSSSRSRSTPTSNLDSSSRSRSTPTSNLDSSLRSNSNKRGGGGVSQSQRSFEDKLQRVGSSRLRLKIGSAMTTDPPSTPSSAARITFAGGIEESMSSSPSGTMSSSGRRRISWPRETNSVKQIHFNAKDPTDEQHQQESFIPTVVPITVAKKIEKKSITYEADIDHENTHKTMDTADADSNSTDEKKSRGRDSAGPLTTHGVDTT